MRRAAVVLAVLLFCLTAYGADYYHLKDHVTTKSGYAVSGASVHVYNPNTTTNPTAYTDLTGITAATFPLTTDSNGMFECYLAQGNYDLYVVHSGHQIDVTWDNYMVGTGTDTLSFSSLDITGTIAAEAFDAADWIDAGGTITGETIETTGLTVVGGTFTTGGAVTVGGDLYVSDQAQFAYDDVEEIYNFRVGPNSVVVEPYLVVENDALIYGNMYLYGKDSASGKLQAQIVETDTLKPRTGDDVYVRAADGQNDATLHGQFFQFEPVDISVSLPDTTDHGVGTLMFCSDDSFRYLAGDGIAKEWRTLAYAGYVAGEDNPALYLPTTELNYAYADSHVQKFGVGNSGEGILSWESSFLSDWIADAANDTGTVGAGYDSVTVQLMWAQIDSGVSVWDTVAVATSYGNGEVVIHAEGKPLVGGGDYVVEANHPRIYFNEDELATLRAKCKSAENTSYTTFIGYVDANYIDDTYPVSQGLERHAKALAALSFAYVVEQDTTYLKEATENAQSLFDDYSTTWDDGEFVQQYYPCFYDWCYGGFGDARKTLFGDSLNAMGDRFMAGTNFMVNAPHSQHSVVHPTAFMGLALYGDGVDDALAVSLLDTCFNHTFGDYHIFACLDSIGRDGGGYEGPGYSESTMNDMLELCWIWDKGTDLAAFDESSCVTGHGTYMLYDTGTDTEVVDYNYSGECVLDPTTMYAFGEGKQGDAEGQFGSLERRMWLTNMLATAYQDSTLTWLAGQYDTHTSGYIPSYIRWEHIVVQDTLMAAAAPTTARGYTTAKQFDNGTVFMREGWDLATASTDVWATYYHGQFSQGHAHADCGSFILGMGNDLLFIDSGEYTTTVAAHDANYFQQTVAHNAITVKLFGEDFDGYANSGGQQFYQFGTASCDIGTVGEYATYLAGDGARGTITDYSHRADTLTYIRSDLTDAYSSSKVDTVRREFVWMEPDGVFLIYDYVYAVEDTFLQKSLFHTIGNPTLNGDDTWTVVQGGSEATLTFYGNASAQEIGGSGYEFWADGQNWPVGACVDYHSDNGAYRIEALPTRSSKTRALVTIIETSVVGGAGYGTVATVAVGDYLGAVVNGDTLLFHKYGGTYQYRAE